MNNPSTRAITRVYKRGMLARTPLYKCAAVLHYTIARATYVDSRSTICARARALLLNHDYLGCKFLADESSELAKPGDTSTIASSCVAKVAFQRDGFIVSPTINRGHVVCHCDNVPTVMAVLIRSKTKNK